MKKNGSLLLPSSLLFARASSFLARSRPCSRLLVDGQTRGRCRRLWCLGMSTVHHVRSRKCVSSVSLFFDEPGVAHLLPRPPIHLCIYVDGWVHMYMLLAHLHPCTFTYAQTYSHHLKVRKKAHDANMPHTHTPTHPHRLCISSRVLCIRCGRKVLVSSSAARPGLVGR